MEFLMGFSFKHDLTLFLFHLSVSDGLEKTLFSSKGIWTLLPLEEEGIY